MNSPMNLHVNSTTVIYEFNQNCCMKISSEDPCCILTGLAPVAAHLVFQKRTGEIQLAIRSSISQ